MTSQKDDSIDSLRGDNVNQMQVSDMEYIKNIETLENKFHSLKRAKDMQTEKLSEQKYYMIIPQRDEYGHPFWTLCEFQFVDMDGVPVNKGDVLYDYDNVPYEVTAFRPSEAADSKSFVMELKNIETQETVTKEFSFDEACEQVQIGAYRMIFWTDDNRKQYHEDRKSDKHFGMYFLHDDYKSIFDMICHMDWLHIFLETSPFIFIISILMISELGFICSIIAAIAVIASFPLLWWGYGSSYPDLV